MSGKFLISLVLGLAVCAACTFRSNPEAARDTQPPMPTATASPTLTSTPESTPAGAAGQSAALKCRGVETRDYNVYEKQTFAIDFEPFRNACFVTSHSPEYEDPPMESRFAIYKGGKNVFDFPSQFNGVNFGCCWVEAVGFQDLNDDKLTDVIVVSKCQAKSDSYNENTVYANTGKSFSTREDANMQLGEMRTIKQVTEFVKDNRSMFF